MPTAPSWEQVKLGQVSNQRSLQFLSIKPVFPVQNTETNIPFQANKNDMGDFCVMVWLHYLAITAFLPVTPVVPFGLLSFLISLYRQDLIASI